MRKDNVIMYLLVFCHASDHLEILGQGQIDLQMFSLLYLSIYLLEIQFLIDNKRDVIMYYFCILMTLRN